MLKWKIDDKISLRPIELKDAERIFQLTDRHRDYLREWLPWVDGTKTIRDTKAVIKKMRKSQEEKKGMTFVILYDNEIVGITSFNSFDWHNKITYIGYWLAADYQGKGIMTKVVRALCNYAFIDLHLNRIEICAAVDNKKSRAIPERLGFKLEGIRRSAEWVNDRFVDHCIYGMLAEEWVTDK